MHDRHVKITRMGHAAMVIGVDNTRVLIDPGGFCRPLGQTKSTTAG